MRPRECPMTSDTGNSVESIPACHCHPGENHQTYHYWMCVKGPSLISVFPIELNWLVITNLSVSQYSFSPLLGHIS